MAERGGKRVNSAIVIMMALLLFFTFCTLISYAEDGTESSIVEYNETIEGGSIYFDTSTGKIVDSDKTVTSVDIPGEIAGVKVSAIAMGAFNECGQLIEVSLNPGIELEQHAFSYCTELKEFAFADSVTAKINGLYNMNGLKKIIIPAGVSYISNLDAQSDFRNLYEYEVDPDNESYCSVNGVLYNKNLETLLSFPKGRSTDVFIVPDTVKKIGERAFEWCTSIKRIVLPEGLETIENCAFRFTNDLDEINLPESLTTIDSAAFLYSGIKRVCIPEKVKCISNLTFVGCRNLKEVYLNNNIEIIDINAFTSNDYPIKDDVIFYAPAASYAEQYVKENGFVSEYVGDPPAQQEIVCQDIISRKYGDPDCIINAKAMTKLSYYSDCPDVASVSEDGYLHVENAGIADIYIEAEYTKEYLSADKVIKIVVSKASPKLTLPKTSYYKTYGAGLFYLGASSKTPIKYKTSKSTIAKVSSEGKVSLVNPGTATITVYSPETENYVGATQKVTINCKLKKETMKAYALSGQKNKIVWTKVPGADAYQVFVKYPGSKNYKRAVTKGPSVKSVVHKGLKKGKTYSYKVRAYRTVNGKKVYTAFSAVRSVKVRK